MQESVQCICCSISLTKMQKFTELQMLPHAPQLTHFSQLRVDLAHFLSFILTFDSIYPLSSNLNTFLVEPTNLTRQRVFDNVNMICSSKNAAFELQSKWWAQNCRKHFFVSANTVSRRPFHASPKLTVWLHHPRIELGAQRWQRWILPLNQWCCKLPLLWG